MRMVRVEIMVPISDIEIINEHCTFTKGDRHHDDEYDSGCDGIYVNGVDYDIEDYDDEAIDQQIVENWKAK